MKKKAPFNRKLLSLLIKTAKGDRSTKQFAAECGISYMQLRKLENGLQENAPGMGLLTKLAAESEGGIELVDYMLVCCIAPKEPVKPAPKKKKVLNIQSKFEQLTASQQKTVYDFTDYLLNKS